MAKGGWTTTSIDEIANQQLQRGIHNFNKKICHWPYCGQCGLIFLRNKPTMRAAKEACIH